MNRSKILAVTLSVAMAAMLLAGCAQPTASNAESAARSNAAESDSVKPEMVLKLATGAAESENATTSNGVFWTTFQDYLSEKSNGKYKLDIFYSSQLASSTEEYFNGLLGGSFDFITCNISQIGTYTTAFAPINAPFFFPSEEGARELLTKSPFREKMNAQFLADASVKQLAYVPMGFRMLTSKKKMVQSPADMKGLKLRTMADPYQIAAFSALGANCTPTPYSELFTALQQGLVDAQESPYITIWGQKIYEVQNYVTETKHNFTSTLAACSDETFNSWPADLQQLVLEAAAVAEQAAWDSVGKFADDAKAKVAEKLEIRELSAEELKAFQDVASTSWDVIKADCGEAYFNEAVAAMQEINEKLEK
ncbi:MAG: TRAP transporter substrate-binding protein [Clostridia bacterium]